MITTFTEMLDGTIALAEGHRRQRVHYCLSTDEKPVAGVKNAEILHLMDWKILSDTEKAAAVAQVWMFDEDHQQWLPQ